MNTFIMLTRLSSQSISSPKTLEALEKKVVERINKQCPEVKWIHNFAITGPYDYLDIFSAPDIQTAFKVSAIIRSFGHAHTELWNAEEWVQFKDLIRELPENE